MLVITNAHGKRFDELDALKLIYNLQCGDIGLKQTEAFTILTKNGHLIMGRHVSNMTPRVFVSSYFEAACPSL
jgi:hypothetical protein